MNNQPAEALSRRSPNELEFHSMFFTIQGEGPFSGQRSIFVRLAGCNLKCPGCDTEYTKGRQVLRVVDILSMVKTMNERHSPNPLLVIVTGGEPTRQPIGLFVEALREFGHPVQIESNGVLAPDESLLYAIRNDPHVYYVVSPKTSRISTEAFNLASCFKYVVDHRHVDPKDGLPSMALEHPASTGVAKPRPGAPVYLTPYENPEGSKDHDFRNLRAAADSAMKHGYILGVQLHKLVGLE